MSQEIVEPTQKIELSFSYTLELWMYGIAFCFGLPSFIYTIVKLTRTHRQNLVLAARLFSFKISLTVADCIILFIYAPTQFLWIQYYWWFGGDIGCRLFKFITTFGFHLTANMQVLVATDRLLITAKMNQLNRNMKKRQYNTNLSLAIAWTLAFVCACPQLLLFRQRSTPHGHTQCISIWTEHRGEYYEKLDIWEQYNYRMELIREKSPHYFYSNGTMKVNRGPEYPSPEHPGFDLDELNTKNHNWLYLERLYNVIHLATICVLPYTMEFISYSLILYILKGASKGRFIGISDVFNDIFCGCFRASRQIPKSPTNSNQEAEQFLSGTSIRNENKDVIAKEEGDIERRRAASFDVPRPVKSSSSVSLNENGRTVTITHQLNHDITDQTVGIFAKLFGKCLPNALLHDCNNSGARLSETGRRKSDQRGRSNTMWVSTVDTARRNARWKAFLMLSLNLLLWAPYCILAITSSVIVSQWLTNFQFVNALITFNAVSNIIL